MSNGQVAGLLFAGILIAWVAPCIWGIIRYLTCDCAVRIAKYGDIELPRHWHVYGAPYAECYCGRRYMDWRTFCDVLAELADRLEITDGQ